ncbi:MAG: ECF transporter S component [Oscillospiraceae bacterium]|nr:ECF transporter S component [Oscillospiraceae bacterium]
MKPKQMTIDAMLSAMCAVLGYLSLDFGNLKFTFESLPILLTALLFGPVDGMLVSGIGTLIYQLLRYGVSATTLLWILPYILCGAMVGFFAKTQTFSFSRIQTILLVVFAELMVTMLNTGVLYIDSRIYGYYSAVYIFGSLGVRLAVCVGKSVAFGLTLPALVKAIRQSIFTTTI